MGSIASFWPRADDFRSTPINRHRYRGSACIALLNADTLEHAHRDWIARQHRFFLDHAVEPLKKTLVEIGNAIEGFSVNIDVALFWRVGGLRERIDPYLLHQRQCGRNIGLAWTVADCPIKRVAVVCRIFDGKVACRDFRIEVRRQQQVLRAFALVQARKGLRRSSAHPRH